MLYLKNWLFLLPLFFLNCESLDFYGDTFYTVKGKIADENDKGIPNLDLLVYTDNNSYANYPKDYFSEGIVSSTAKTDENGDFLITFPKSNGFNFLVLEDDYQIIDSVNAGASNTNMARLQIVKFRGYLLDLNTIKITKP